MGHNNGKHKDPEPTSPPATTSPPEPMPTFTPKGTRTGTPAYTASPSLTQTEARTATLSMEVSSPDPIPDGESRAIPKKIIFIVCSIFIVLFIFTIVVVFMHCLRRKKRQAGNRTWEDSVGSSHGGVHGGSNPLSVEEEVGESKEIQQTHFYTYMPAPPVRLSEEMRLHLSEGNREAFRSIRMHQINNMNVDEATRFHLLRHAETAFVEFGPFVDSDSD
ncbi:per-hexamer repeat protein 5 [Trypanosoma cruzi cruzi]|nr:per-hexamer repeat protein 5 [Trypanosoma cruzi cruzi]PBJ74588.1 per-hexamer repeat protein 5 [Trypanosoma cruzi cruzi]